MNWRPIHRQPGGVSLLGGERAPRSPRRAAAAADDGAAARMEVDGGAHVAGRVFCPVAGCPCADPLRAPGWASATTMHAHIDAHLAGSGVRCVASACLPAMPFTLPVGHRPEQQPVLQVECPGWAPLHCPPSLRSKLVARPPFAISRQRQGPCGARFSPKLWRPWCTTTTLAVGKIFWPCPSVC